MSEPADEPVPDDEVEAIDGLGPRVVGGGGVFSRAGSQIAEGRVLTPLSAFLAWAVTVAPAAFARGSSASAKVFAIAALLAGVVGPMALVKRPRLARHAGVTLFLVFSAATWLDASLAVDPSRLDPVRAIFGAIAWGVFALSWSERSSSPRGEPLDPAAPALRARARLPILAVPLTAAGVLAALGALVLAWRISDPERALVAHAVACGGAVALVSAAATVATARGRQKGRSGRRLTSSGMRALILLGMVLLVGAVVLALR